MSEAMSNPLTNDERAYPRRAIGTLDISDDCYDQHIDHAVARWDRYWDRPRDLGRIGTLALQEVLHRLNPDHPKPYAAEIFRAP